jgi:hypothetical protein
MRCVRRRRGRFGLTTVTALIALAMPLLVLTTFVLPSLTFVVAPWALMVIIVGTVALTFGCSSRPERVL